LLANLYHIPSKTPYSQNVDLTDLINYTPLIEESLNIISAIRIAMEDDTLFKAKRIRDILKVTEKLLTFSSLVRKNTTILNAFTLLKPSLRKIVEHSASKGVKLLSNRLLEIITEEKNLSQSVEHVKNIRKRKSDRVISKKKKK